MCAVGCVGFVDAEEVLIGWDEPVRSSNGRCIVTPALVWVIFNFNFNTYISNFIVLRT